MLAVHGYTDYFFNTELADHFAARGFAFYALDLHKCGRSWRDGQTPHFTTDLARYDAELERALDVIAQESGGAGVCVYGHSAGGLIVTLWLDRLRRRGATAALGVDGLVLNSPFLDLHGPAILRTAADLGGADRAGPAAQDARWSASPPRAATAPRCTGTTRGDFDYDLSWKPLGGFPVTFGWINAIRRGQARLHRGLDVGVPNLILRSDHSVPEARGPTPSSIQRGDAVLDVAPDRPLGRLRRQPHHDRAHRRRQARCLPVAARAARRRPTANSTGGWTGIWASAMRRIDHINRRFEGTALNDVDHFDLTIIGTGSGNSILDERYADKKVAICEQGTFGGTCLNVGCIPTKMFVYAAEVAATVR